MRPYPSIPAADETIETIQPWGRSRQGPNGVGSGTIFQEDRSAQSTRDLVDGQYIRYGFIMRNQKPIHLDT